MLVKEKARTTMQNKVVEDIIKKTNLQFLNNEADASLFSMSQCFLQKCLRKAFKYQKEL